MIKNMSKYLITTKNTITRIYILYIYIYILTFISNYTKNSRALHPNKSEFVHP